MEDPVIAEQLEQFETVSDEIVKNVTGRAAASGEGLALAYFSLFMMATVPIFWGSFRSVIYHKTSKVGNMEFNFFFFMLTLDCIRINYFKLQI